MVDMNLEDTQPYRKEKKNFIFLFFLYKLTSTLSLSHLGSVWH